MTTFGKLVERFRKRSKYRVEYIGANLEAPYLTIQRSSDLYLPILGYGDDVRFAEIFRDTWRRIPLWGRRGLVGYWRKDGRNSLVAYMSPRIELLREWIERDDGNIFGAVARAGHQLQFWAPVVDAFPEVHVGELIAHELAHVFLVARGWEGTTNRKVHRWDDPTEVEADKVMEDWGFDPDAMDDWIWCHRPDFTKRRRSRKRTTVRSS